MQGMFITISTSLLITRLRPEMALKALPHLMKDLESPNPLLRALTLRTISTVHVREYVECLIAPLKHLLKDRDPYVRKTAAMAVAKLHGHDRVALEKTHLVNALRDLLSDGNSTVGVWQSLLCYNSNTYVLGRSKCSDSIA